MGDRHTQHRAQHSRTQWHSTSNVAQHGTVTQHGLIAHQTHQGGRLYATGHTAQHTAQSHGAHSQEWHTPSHDPHTVGNGFGNEKIFDPAGMCF